MNNFQFFKNLLFSDYSIDINITLMIFTTIIFLILFVLRDKPIFSTFNTISGFIPVLVHELGHALMCSMTFGKVQDIRIVLTKRNQNKTGSQGYTSMSMTSLFNKIFTTFAGYTAVPLLLLSGIYLSTHKGIIIFLLLLIILALYYFMKTRQKITASVLIVLIIFSIISINANTFEIWVTIIISILLGLFLGELLQSLYIRTILTFKSKNDDWDGAQLSDYTHMPVLIWYVLWLCIDSYVVFQIIKILAIYH